MTIYEEQAYQMVRRFGYTEALIKIQWYRDQNSEGSASYAFHNAVAKTLRLFATVGKV